MTLMDRRLARNRTIARRFGDKADRYDDYARLQRRVAARLAKRLPTVERPDVLEVGCGTGFLTRRLIGAYPDANLLITDLSPRMIERCREGVDRSFESRVRFAQMDGEAPDTSECFDLVALSMTLQWFTDPVAGLLRLAERLKPGGRLYFATIGPGNFPEWRAALEREALPFGFVAMPALPGVTVVERVPISYGSGVDFLASLKAIGAGEPRPGYRPLSSGQLRRALRRLEKDAACRVTWEFVYGELPGRAGGR